MAGATKQFTVAVEKRSYSRMCGTISDEQHMKTFGSASRRMALACLFVVGIDIGVDEADRDRLDIQRGQRAARCEEVTHDRVGRSLRPTIRSFRGPPDGADAAVRGGGRTKRTSKMLPGTRRRPRPISTASRNPFVVISPVRAPLPSSRMLVAIVVPWQISANAIEPACDARQPAEDPLRLIACRRHLPDLDVRHHPRRRRRGR